MDRFPVRQGKARCAKLAANLSFTPRNVHMAIFDDREMGSVVAGTAIAREFLFHQFRSIRRPNGHDAQPPLMSLPVGPEDRIARRQADQPDPDGRQDRHAAGLDVRIRWIGELDCPLRPISLIDEIDEGVHDDGMGGHIIGCVELGALELGEQQFGESRCACSILSERADGESHSLTSRWTAGWP